MVAFSSALGVPSKRRLWTDINRRKRREKQREKQETCCEYIVSSIPIDRTRDVSYSLSHPYRQDSWCVVFFIPPLSTWSMVCLFFIPPLSTGPVMCRILYSILSTGPVMCRIADSIPTERTRYVSYSLFHPYRQDPSCVVFFISPLSTGPVMCRILYFTPIDRTRDVPLARFPFNQRAVKRSFPRATRGYQNEGPKGMAALLQ